MSLLGFAVGLVILIIIGIIAYIAYKCHGQNLILCILGMLFGHPWTDCNKFGPSGVPTSCPVGSEFYGSACYKNPDPTRFVRTAVCTVWDNNYSHLWTDCEKFGISGTVGSKTGPGCPPNTDLWGGLCYKKCPDKYKRTAICTCSIPGLLL